MFWLPILIRLVWCVRPDLLIRGRRLEIADMRARGKVGPRGDGFFREHISGRGLFDFIAVCGMPLRSLGGSGERANCHACIRLARRAGVWPTNHAETKG